MKLGMNSPLKSFGNGLFSLEPLKGFSGLELSEEATCDDGPQKRLWES
jgi:hypothetical protein